MPIDLVVGLDLAWKAGDRNQAGETGMVVLERSDHIRDIQWPCGVDETMSFIETLVPEHDALVFVDAPLVVPNAIGQRLCERQVGQ